MTAEEEEFRVLDQFAGQAMQTLVAGHIRLEKAPPTDAGLYARAAYDLAEAMMRERQRRQHRKAWRR